jgi:predicted NAD-dependent protein-ADP-ribosyltransferase YbiA (DUF1768 family)
MVVSKIDSKIIYEENVDIFPEDDEFESLVYPIEISFKGHDKTKSAKKYNIVFGKVREEKKKDGVIYFPIYLVVNDEATARIGVLEIEPQKYAYILDENDDIDPEKIPEPLFYNFINENFLKKYELEETEKEDDLVVEADEEYDAETGKFNVKKNDESQDKQDLFEIPQQEYKALVDEEQPLVTDKTHTFTIDQNLKTPALLTEESSQDASELRKEYQETVNSNWINKFMENNEYTIQDNEGGGDCLFAVVRDAFAQIGHHTTVDKLRNLLAELATDAIFQEYRQVFLDMENSVVENEKKIKSFSDIYRDSKQKINKSGESLSQLEHAQLLEQAKHAKTEVKILQDENRLNRELLRSEFGYMKDIDTLEKFQNYIRTSSYWADTWAITTLEKKLNFKLIIFSESAFNHGSHDSVLNCGEANKEIQEQGIFTPNYYIMTSYSGHHYRLILYKNKMILTYREIPYDVKTLVLNKCMEHNSGIFYLIQDFRNLKAKIGLSADEGAPIDYDQDDFMDALYDKDIVFMYHSKSQDDVFPGKGSGETIPKNKTLQFKSLHKIKDWRRKLDDSWNKARFELDGHQWASVEHYYQASKFKKGFPDFYIQFSLDSKDSKFSEDVALAKIAGGKKPTDYRPKTVIIDPDFYEERNIKERMDALRNKFQQNVDLREMLFLTNPAKLTHFIRRSPVEVDESLMRVRKELMEKSGLQ